MTRGMSYPPLFLRYFVLVEISDAILVQILVTGNCPVVRPCVVQDPDPPDHAS